MKTMANCTTIEFFKQCNVIMERIKSYGEGIKRIKEAQDLEDKSPLNVISYICGENLNETMELCGALCFMSGEEFANLDPTKEGGEDGIAAISEIFSSERVMSFFISAFKMKKLYDML